jgi:hypothetical protein
MFDRDSILDWMEAHKLKGGSEHKLGGDPVSLRVVKTVSVRQIGSETLYGHLTDYLLGNHFWADDVTLEGFYEGSAVASRKGDNLHIVISQPWRVGNYPTKENLKKWGVQRGWNYQGGPETNPHFIDPAAGKMSLWDVRPDNAIEDNEGVINPVDFHFYFADDVERQRSVSAIERASGQEL